MGMHGIVHNFCGIPKVKRSFKRAPKLLSQAQLQYFGTKHQRYFGAKLIQFGAELKVAKLKCSAVFEKRIHFG